MLADDLKKKNRKTVEMLALSPATESSMRAALDTKMCLLKGNVSLAPYRTFAGCLRQTAFEPSTCPPSTAQRIGVLAYRHIGLRG